MEAYIFLTERHLKSKSKKEYERRTTHSTPTAANAQPASPTHGGTAYIQPLDVIKTQLFLEKSIQYKQNGIGAEWTGIERISGNSTSAVPKCAGIG